MAKPAWMRQWRSRTIAPAICALVLAGHPALPATAGTKRPEITIASLTDYPPYSGANLPNNGATTEIVRTAFERAGYDPTVNIMPWARALKSVKLGENDVLAHVWYRQYRTRFLHYADAIAVSRMVFAKRADADFIYTGIDDLSGKVVATIRGYAYSPAFRRARNFYREVMDGLPQALGMVAAGHADLAIGDSRVIEHILNTERSDIRDDIALTANAFARDPMYVAVSRKHPRHATVVERFNAALARMRANGTYAGIMARHGLR